MNGLLFQRCCTSNKVQSNFVDVSEWIQHRWSCAWILVLVVYQIDQRESAHHLRNGRTVHLVAYLRLYLRLSNQHQDYYSTENQHSIADVGSGCDERVVVHHSFLSEVATIHGQKTTSEQIQNDWAFLNACDLKDLGLVTYETTYTTSDGVFRYLVHDRWVVDALVNETNGPVKIVVAFCDVVGVDGNSSVLHCGAVLVVLWVEFVILRYTIYFGDDVDNFAADILGILLAAKVFKESIPSSVRSLFLTLICKLFSGSKKEVSHKQAPSRVSSPPLCAIADAASVTFFVDLAELNTLSKQIAAITFFVSKLIEKAASHA
uniref:Uncharacterized protein n=1 Tax=Glossina palpalis gambiensis TaxID=67801 RepID=A0A1B0BNQ0_9MUSC